MQVLLLVLHIAWVGAALLLQQANISALHHHQYLDAHAPYDADADVQGIDADAQAEKRRQSGLPWLLVTVLMIAAQIVGASLAATDFGYDDYNVNFDDHHVRMMRL